jgi:hypothetical protein
MKPWEQQPDESSKAHEAFRLYAEMGSDRSLEKVCQDHTKSIPMIKNWSVKYQWVARARAFDMYLADLELQMMESEFKDRAKKWADRKEKMLEKEWAYSERLMERAEEMLKIPLLEQIVSDDGQTIVIRPVRWSASTMLSTIDLGSKLMRLAVGEPTSRTESNQTQQERPSSVDYSKLSESELETLLRLLQKASDNPESRDG